MSIRHFVVAALAASACAAHADVIPSSAPPSQPSFLSGWVTGNGTDVLGSGVLSGNLTFIGGIAHSSASVAGGSQGTLADVLYGKASAAIQGVEGQAKLTYKQGIEGNYLVGAGHGILAAMLGNGISVVSSSDGVVVTPGVASAVGGGGGGGGGAVGGADAGGGGASTGGGSGSGSSGGGSSGGGATGGGGSGSTGGSSGGGSTGGSGSVPVPSVTNPPIGGIIVPPMTPAAEVPEPSSIALLLAGMIGAGALKRRRNR